MRQIPTQCGSPAAASTIQSESDGKPAAKEMGRFKFIIVCDKRSVLENYVHKLLQPSTI
jgi:hypothetical protein